MDEAEAIDKIASLARTQLEQDYPPTVRPVRRGQHAKAHGCVRAEFIVPSDVPGELRHGLFREPGTYPALIRYSSSSGSPVPAPDSKRDAHGMAIKVMGVDGEKVLASDPDATTQDFILVNSKAFICRNPSDYVELLSRARDGKVLRFFFGWNPAKWRLREFVNLLASLRAVRNPLQIRYWSQTPYALGPHVVKYSAKPQSDKGDRRTSTGRDYLEHAMRRQLAKAECRFDFMVQVRTDPDNMPVEDPTIDWKERRSPFQTVANIRIPVQDFGSGEQTAFAENLSFSPWHTLPEHQPMGGINRVRKVIYELISDLRRAKNGVPRREPTAYEVP